MPSTITDRLNGLTTSVAVKAPCRVATTAAITLSGEQTIDGVAVVSGDRVLVMNQSSAVNNGIYIVSTGTWRRAADFDGSLDAVGGTQVHVISGTAYSNTYWRLDGNDTTVVIGTDSVAFEPAGLSDSAAHNFLQDGDDAETRSTQDKMREWVSVLDFVHPTLVASVRGGTTAATIYIHAAMTTLMARFAGSDTFYSAGPGEPAAGGATQFERRDRRTGRIYLPAGKYKVAPEVFSSLTDARAAYVGFEFFGDGPKATILELQTGGAEAWFYKTSAGNERYQTLEFNRIGLTSDNYLYGNFAKVYSTGGPKQFTLDRCRVSEIQTFMHTTGTGNADLNRITNSWIEHYGSMLILDNDQSVQHDFLGTHIRSWAPQVDVREHGGGNVNIKNCAIDLIWDERFSPSTGTYLFTHASNASIAAGNCTYKWEDCRIEVEAYALRSHVRASTNSAGYPVGSTTITLASSGTGAIAIGDKIRFNTTDRTIYPVTSGDADVSNGGSITIAAPGLVQEIPAANTTIYTNEPPLGVVKTVENANANPRIELDNVNFVSGQTRIINSSGTVTGDPDGEFRRLYAFKMWPRKHVEIRGGVLLKNFFYTFDGSRDSTTPNGGGLVQITTGYDGINGELPTGDSSLATPHHRTSYGGSAGRLITESMTPDHTTGSSFIVRLQDADPRGPTNSFGAEPACKVKRAYFKHTDNGWPFTANGGNDHYVVLPPGLTDVKIYISKPASGASTTDYRLRVGNGDKSVVYGNSTTAQFKDAHSIELEHIDLSAQTQLRLWADDGAGGGAGSDFLGGGIAYIEYV